MLHHRRSLWISLTIKASFSRRELGREIFGNLYRHAVVTVGGNYVFFCGSRVIGLIPIAVS